jgi:hypothetical protein
MIILYIYMNPKRLRPNLIHIYLHPEEDKFVKEYAESNYLTVSDLVRGWIHEAMKREGYKIKEPYLPEQKSKKRW